MNDYFDGFIFEEEKEIVDQELYDETRKRALLYKGLAQKYEGLTEYILNKHSFDNAAAPSPEEIELSAKYKKRAKECEYLSIKLDAEALKMAS